MRINLNELRRIIIEALKNAYEILGVSPTASDEDIKKAWRALAVSNHLDKGGSHGKMVDINNAKDRLMDKTALFRYGPSFKGYEDPNAPKAPGPSAEKPSGQSGWNVQVIRTCPKCGKRVVAKGNSPDNTTFDPHTAGPSGAQCSGSGTRAPKDADGGSTTGDRPTSSGCTYCGRTVAVKDGNYVNHYQYERDRDMPNPPKCPNSSRPAPRSSGRPQGAPPPPPPPRPGPVPGGAPAAEDRFYYTYSRGSSHKFWEVEVVGNVMHVRWGRIGSQGQTTSKSYPSSWDAKSAASRMRTSKIHKGYTRGTPPGNIPRPSSQGAGPGRAAPGPQGPRPAAAGRPNKDSYKVYPWRGGRRVVRVGGKLYGTGLGGNLAGGGQTRFNSNDRAQVTPDGRRMKVKKTDSDHTQTWDPVDEVRQVVDELVLEMIARVAEV